MRTRTLLTSLDNAWRGLREAIATQPNIRRHLAAGTIVLATAMSVHLGRLDCALLLLTILLVLMAELFNTAIEVFIDRLSPAKREDARMVKDIAAAAVLVCAIGAVVIGLLIFLPRLTP